MQYVPATQPESVKLLLARSLRLYRISFLRVIFFALMLATTAFVPRFIALIHGENIFISTTEFNPERLWFMLLDILDLIVFAIIFWRIHCIEQGIHESVMNDVEKSLKKLPFVFVASIIQTFVYTLISYCSISFYVFYMQKYLLASTTHLQFFLLCIPLFLQLIFNIYVVILLLFYLPLIVTQDNGIFRSIAHSAHLVWKHWWQTLKVQLTPWAVYILVLIAVKYTFKMNIHIYFFNVAHLTWPGTIVHLLIFAVFLPWSAAALMVQLQDLELREKLRNI